MLPGQAVFPRVLPDSDSEDEQEAFMHEFENRVLDVVRQVRRRFPFKHSIRWSIKLNDMKTYRLRVTAECLSPQAIVAYQARFPPAIEPRSLPGDCRDEEQAFIREFEQLVSGVAREVRRRFPYKQLIEWSMEYGDDQKAVIEVQVEARRS